MHRRLPVKNRSSAFTLIEVVISLVLLTIAFVGFGSFFVLTTNSYHSVKEDTLAIHSLRQMAEKIRCVPFARIVTNCQGMTFAIDEIKASGSVRIFINETDGSSDARILGLPRDLDGDGVASTTDVTSDYLLLPIKIEVSWTNVKGPRSESLYMLLAQETS